jgi:hypothetical protein
VFPEQVSNLLFLGTIIGGERVERMANSLRLAPEPGESRHPEVRNCDSLYHGIREVNSLPAL